MSKEWTCLYCNAANSLSTRFCVKCNAGLLDLGRQTLQTQQHDPAVDSSKGVGILDLHRHRLQKHVQESGTEAISEMVVTEPSEKKPIVTIPRPGDLVSGLFQLTSAVQAGTITSHQFETTLEEVSDRLDAAFEEIIAEFMAIPDETGEYIPMVRDMMKSVQFLFEVSLEEMARFAEDKNPIHLYNGQRTAQQAEMDYIGIARMIQRDATMNPFAGQSDVLSDLASRVVEGHMNIDTYRENLENLKNHVEELLKKGQELYRSGFEKALNFEGADEQIIYSARDDFQGAAENLSNAIINLYSPEDVRSVLEEIVEETIDQLEEEWEE